MKRSLAILGMVSALAWTTGVVQSREEQRNPDELIFVSAENAQFEEVAPGVSRAVLWGNPDKEPYGAFTKFEPEVDAGLHTHTNDVWLVVLKGALLYEDKAGRKRVGPGSFIRIPGGKKHWSGSSTKVGALFYEESSGKFDMIPAK